MTGNPKPIPFNDFFWKFMKLHQQALDTSKKLREMADAREVHQLRKMADDLEQAAREVM